MVRAIIEYESSPIPIATGSTSRSTRVQSCATRSATGRCSVPRSGTRSTGTTRSSSGPTWTRSKRLRARGVRRLGEGRRVDGGIPLRSTSRPSSDPRLSSRSRGNHVSPSSRSLPSNAGEPRTPPLHAHGQRDSPMSEPTHTHAIRRLWLPGDRQREGAASRHHPAEPSRRPERVRLPDAVEIARAAEDASWDDEVRVVVVTGTGRAVLRRRRPPLLGRGLPGKPSDYWKWFGAFKDVHDRLRRDQEPTIARINGIAVGAGTGAAADGVRPGCHRGDRVHPPRRPRARVGARGRCDLVAPAHGRRPARARDRVPE